MNLKKKLEKNNIPLTHDGLFGAFMDQRISGSEYGKGTRIIDGDPFIQFIEADIKNLIRETEYQFGKFYGGIKNYLSKNK
jgi:hypothetical protein